MARYVNKPNLADVARRRGQSIFEVLEDWGIDIALPEAEFDVEVQKRCTKEGVRYEKVERPSMKTSTPKKIVVVEPPKESAPVVGKKVRKSKVTLDEPVAGDEHVGVDSDAPFGPKDPA